MRNQNIVKLDRTTVQEYLPMLTHRGVFSNFINLPLKEDILNEEKARLNITSLTSAQERAVLSKVGKYRSNAYVIRDYEDYVIAFSAKMYLENLNNTEQQLKDEVLNLKYNDKQIQDALKRISTYKLAHKIALILLGEVYKQGKHEAVVITKSGIVEALGYTTAEKYIYTDIREAVHSLRWLDYVIYNYNTKKKLKEESKTTGNFIYNLSESSTEFKVWVNPLFVGCAIHMAADGAKLGQSERKSLFERGYLDYPLDYITESRSLSDAAYFLGHYLLTQNGNAKLNTKDRKVIAVSVENLMKEARIEHSRSNVRVNKLLGALEEIAHVQQIEPSIEELRKKKSKDVEKLTLHIHIPQQKKSNPKRAKNT